MRVTYLLLLALVCNGQTDQAKISYLTARSRNADIIIAFESSLSPEQKALRLQQQEMLGKLKQAEEALKQECTKQDKELSITNSVITCQEKKK